MDMYLLGEVRYRETPLPAAVAPVTVDEPDTVGEPGPVDDNTDVR
jgi:hypothetical protein